MTDLLLDSLLDAFLDTLRILPFLFLTYLAMEWLEHRAENPMRLAIRNGGHIGPLIGAALGVVPQCGFSATASSLFAGGVISLGTLLSVVLSTSDEMLPLLLTAGAGIRMILVILGIKALYAMAAGFLRLQNYVSEPRRLLSFREVLLSFREMDPGKSKKSPKTVAFSDFYSEFMQLQNYSDHYPFPTNCVGVLP